LASRLRRLKCERDAQSSMKKEPQRRGGRGETQRFWGGGGEARVCAGQGLHRTRESGSNAWIGPRLSCLGGTFHVSRGIHPTANIGRPSGTGGMTPNGRKEMRVRCRAKGGTSADGALDCAEAGRSTRRASVGGRQRPNRNPKRCRHPFGVWPPHSRHGLRTSRPLAPVFRVLDREGKKW
jgi:hypothetical protein